MKEKCVTLPPLFKTDYQISVHLEKVEGEIDIYLLIYWRVSTNWSLMTIRQLKIWLMPGILVQLTRHICLLSIDAIEFKISGPTAPFRHEYKHITLKICQSQFQNQSFYWKIQYSSLIRQVYFGHFTLIACRIDLFILSVPNRVGKLGSNKLRILNWTFFIFNEYSNLNFGQSIFSIPNTDALPPNFMTSDLIPFAECIRLYDTKLCIAFDTYCKLNQ